MITNYSYVLISRARVAQNNSIRQMVTKRLFPRREKQRKAGNGKNLFWSRLPVTERGQKVRLKNHKKDKVQVGK